MTNEQLLAQIEALKTENAKLKATKTGGPSCKVTDKGGVSFYGVGRFPVTLYKAQWDKLLANADQIKAFIAAHEAELTEKPVKLSVVKAA